MGLGVCHSILKFVLVLFSFIFGLVGITGIVFSIWMLVDPTFSFTLTQNSTDYLISVIIILVASIMLVIVAILGIIGAFREQQCALITFFVLLLIIFVAEISAGVWVYINCDSLEVQLRSAVKSTVEHDYHHNANQRLLFDTFQRNLQCCGAERPSDWMGSGQVTMGVTSDPKRYNIPRSCCRPDRSEEECTRATQGLVSGTAIDESVVFKDGCYTIIIEKMEENLFLIFCIGIAVAIIQLLALVFSLVLAFTVNKSNRYKA